jgi:DNA (cytosine-5)-methyltransferase 1
MNNRPKTFIDLFSGIGGFHQALQKCDMECVFASEIDANCRMVYKDNYGIEPAGDITKVDIKKIPKFDVLCAGFPCQPFSKAGNQDGFSDTRGNLFFDICKIVEFHRPMYLLLENVRNITTHDNKKTWVIIMNSILKLGYSTTEGPLILNVLHFNIPQNRERVVILCKRNDLGMINNIPIIPPTPKNKLSNHLETIVDGTKGRLSIKEQSVYDVYNDFLSLIPEIPKFPLWTDHWDINHLDTDPFYIKYKKWIESNKKFYNDNIDVLRPWLQRSRLNSNWVGSIRKFEWQVGDNSIKTLDNLLWSLRGSGVRVKKCNYIPTLTALSMVPIYGPLRRRLNPKELIKLQSFRDNFKYDEKTIFKQLGNAVNVTMIYRCAKFLMFDEPLFIETV